MTIGIITVAFNSGNTINRTLASIESQTIQPDEIIIIDGQSSDNTLDIVKEYMHLPIKVLSERDTGIYNAMNKGLKICSSEIVGFLNSDDAFCDIYCIERIKQGMKSPVKVFCSGVNYVNNSDKIIRKWIINEASLNFAKGGHVPHPGFYTHLSIIKELNGFNEEYEIASDFDLMLRILTAVKVEAIYFDEGILVNMLHGGTSNSNIKNIFKGNREIRQSLRNSGYNITFAYTIRRWFAKALTIMTN